MTLPGESSGSRPHSSQFSFAQQQQHQDFGDGLLDNPLLSVFADIPELPVCELPRSDPLLLSNNSCPIVGSGSDAKENRFSARRIIKADRERLRRDKLNEQFLELASSLDPDRPKNDKGTILCESIQLVKDLRDEIKRLKKEHATLLEESRDLTQEKSDLRAEKASLKNETDQLKYQIQQRLQSSCPWMVPTPAAFSYPMPIQQPFSVPVDSNPLSGPSQAMFTALPYMHLVPPMGTCPMHSLVQPYDMYSSRVMDERTNNYIHYPAFSNDTRPAPQIERPCAQYPSLTRPNLAATSVTSENQLRTGPQNPCAYLPNSEHCKTYRDTYQEFEGDLQCSLATTSHHNQPAGSNSVNIRNKFGKGKENDSNDVVDSVASLCAKGKLDFTSQRSEIQRLLEEGIPTTENDNDIANDAILRPPAA